MPRINLRTVAYDVNDNEHVKAHINRLRTWKHARQNITKNGRGNLDTNDLDDSIRTAIALLQARNVPLDAWIRDVGIGLGMRIHLPPLPIRDVPPTGTAEATTQLLKNTIRHHHTMPTDEAPF